MKRRWPNLTSIPGPKIQKYIILAARCRIPAWRKMEEMRVRKVGKLKEGFSSSG